MARNTLLFTATEVGHIVHDLVCTFNIVSQVFEDEESIGVGRGVSGPQYGSNRSDDDIENRAGMSLIN